VRLPPAEIELVIQVTAAEPLGSDDCTVKELDLNAFDDFQADRVNRRVLFDDAVMRVVLVSIPAGHELPNHPAPGLITIHSLSGKVIFTEGGASCELVAGKLIRVTPAGLHSARAIEDSRLLVTLIKQSDVAAWTALLPAGQDVDLRGTPLPRRHGIVFSAFDVLSAGESFVLVNDHDPQPLRMQMDLLRPGEMEWEYLDRTPDNFRVKISRIAPPRAGAGQTFLVADSHD
jgi:uncharacterized protein (DUF2249 family)